MSFAERWRKVAAKGNKNTSSDNSSNDSGEEEDKRIGEQKVQRKRGERGERDMDDLKLPKFMFNDGGFLDSDKFKFGAKYLKTACGNNIDPKNKELYLDEVDFKEVFGMPIERFKGLRLWKQKELKRKFGLF